VALAARGSRLIASEREPITDPAELRQVRRQARRVHLQAFLAAVVLTLLALALPA
jgi:hypothetical protein